MALKEIYSEALPFKVDGSWLKPSRQATSGTKLPPKNGKAKGFPRRMTL